MEGITISWMPYLVFIFALLTLRINAVVINGFLSYSDNGLQGTYASIGCNWTSSSSEIVTYLNVSSQSNKYFLLYVPLSNSTQNGTNYHSRLRVTTTTTSLTMTIVNISCLDVDRYFCKLSYFASGSPMESVTPDMPLDIKIRPEVPVMRRPSVQVLEGSDVTYKCTANLGRPNKGKLEWKSFINNLPDGVSYLPNVVQKSDDNNCTVITESTVTLKANRTMQNFVLACFSSSLDFPSQVPPLCTSPSTDLCDQSQPLNILYAVSKLIVNMIPQTAVEEFSTITLTCQAEGNPQPTYTWLQVGNENRSLTGVQDGLTNKLTLMNLSIANDAGVYNCTATNNVNGVNYSVTDQVSVSVYPKTTTTSTTTTTRRTTTSTSSSPTGSQSQATAPQNAGGDDDNTNTIIIAVVVPLACIIIIIIIVVIVCVKKRKQPKSIIEEPSVKPYNNLSMVNQNFNKSPKPDLVTGDKKFNNDNLDSKNYQSGDQKSDALQYVDLNYDNQPRSRKPIALSDASSTSEDYFPEV